ncbi:MAG: NifU family protein [Actinomycetes bacterium]
MVEIMSATDLPDSPPTTAAPDADGTTGDSGDVVIMAVTDAALGSVLAIRDEEPDPEALALRVAITGIRGSEFTYDLGFEPIVDLDGEHARYVVGDGALTVAVPADSVDRLAGATLDLPTTSGQGGLVIRNPNRPDPLAGIAVELTGELPDKVTTLLAEHINPSLAAHGGYAELVGVDDDNNVYVTMGGGCQGCSLSAATLQDGIRSAIKSNLPEVAEVIDATDHAAGEHPWA